MASDIMGRLREWIGGAGRLLGAKGQAESAFCVASVLSDAQTRALQRWYNLYTGQPPWARDGVYPLGLPQAICRELRRVVTNEMNLKLSGGSRADYLQAQLEPALQRIRDTLEPALALGGMAIKPYVTGGDHLRIGLDAVSAAAFLPVRFDESGRCVAGIFRSDPVTADGKTYIKMEYHHWSGGSYTVSNRAFRSSGSGEAGSEVPLETVPEWAEIPADITIRNVDGPLFGYFRCPGGAAGGGAAESVGASIYAGATEDLIREADLQWSRYIDEFVTAKRRIMAADEAVRGNLPGGGANPLALDSLYVAMPYDNAEDFFHEFSPTLRDSGFYDGLQAVLRRIEFNCGLSYGDLSDPATVEKTAAEIITAKNRKYSTVSGIETALESAIRQAVYGMDVYTTLYHLAPRGNYDLQITWDDSILEDTTTERARDMQEVAAGLMSRAEYRMKWYGEDENAARRSLAQIAAEQKTGSSDPGSAAADNPINLNSPGPGVNRAAAAEPPA